MHTMRSWRTCWPHVGPQRHIDCPVILLKTVSAQHTADYFGVSLKRVCSLKVPAVITDLCYSRYDTICTVLCIRLGGITTHVLTTISTCWSKMHALKGKTPMDCVILAAQKQQRSLNRYKSKWKWQNMYLLIHLRPGRIQFSKCWRDYMSKRNRLPQPTVYLGRVTCALQAVCYSPGYWGLETFFRETTWTLSAEKHSYVS